MRVKKERSYKQRQRKLLFYEKITLVKRDKLRVYELQSSVKRTCNDSSSVAEWRKTIVYGKRMALQIDTKRC